MKNSYKLLFVFLLISTWPVLAQQNFFNVPSSDITPAKKIFFQQQINVVPSALQSGTTLCYGLGKNYEVGVNFIGLTYEHEKNLFPTSSVAPFAPFFVFNAQKKFEINESFSVGNGGQFGFTSNMNHGIYLYSNGIYKIEKLGTKIVTGLYYTTDGYFGAESRNFFENDTFRKIGLQAGIEQNLWKEKLLFQADFISGKHALGELVLGGAYFISEHWILSAGLQIPTFQSKSTNAFVFELTFVPSAH
jgi:hypothetical protein